MDAALDRELEVFDRELPRLLADPANSGRFVLIHGDDLAGVWPTVEAATEAGYDRFELDAFLVKEIVEIERPKYFSRNISQCP
jgi:hypothetical protein